MFRLLLNLKDITGKIIADRNADGTQDFKKVLKTILSKGKQIKSDFHLSMLHYSQSYDYFKNIKDKLNNLMLNTVKNQKFALKIEAIQNDQESFWNQLLSDNREFIIETARSHFSEGNEAYKKFFKDIKYVSPTGKEVELAAKDVYMLSRTIIEELNAKEPTALQSLKDLVSEESRKEIYKAIIQSLETESIKPLLELKESKAEKVSLVELYFDLLKGDFSKHSAYAESIINALKAKSDLNLIAAKIIELNNTLMELDLKTNQKIDTRDALVKDQIKANKKLLMERASELKTYLDQPIEELTIAVESKMPESEINEIRSIIGQHFPK